jgi:hypothetical protein
LDPEAVNASPPEYYMFHAYYNTPTRLNSVGAYAVNKRTADLWERLSCQRLNSPQLTQLQKDLRKSLLSQPMTPGEVVKPCI